GDSSFASSHESQPLIQTVKALSSRITLASSQSATNVGDMVTFTATVTSSSGSGVPTGSVTFSIDGKAQAPGPLKLVNGHEQAQFQTTTLSAGKHVINATYNGDAAYATSQLAAPLSQTVIARVVNAPTVRLVQRFGVHMQPTVLLLTFSGALDPPSAQNVNN